MDPDLTIILLGNSGVGKSASGNTILGQTEFESLPAFRSVTKQISEATADVFGKQIKVVDTPGILEAEREIRTLCQNLLQSSSPCLFLVVFKVGSFTREQNKVLATAISVIGPQGFKNCHLLFTGGDALKDTLEDFVPANSESSPPDTFSERCHLFDNENGGQEQVRELLIKSGHLRTQQHLELPDQRIMLLGLPGGGKSSSGNAILGSHQFRSAGGFNLVTTETVSKSVTVEGRRIVVMDTPGFTQVQSLRELHTNIMKWIVEASPGPHTFIFVVRIGSMPAEHIKLFELLLKLFDSDVCAAHRYSMVLFTHGDELEGRSIDGLIQSNRHVSALVSMCGGRYCVFDNKAKRNREQVRHFLNKIDEMVTANGGEHFTSDLFRMAERLINEERSLSGETAGETGASALSGNGGKSASVWKIIYFFLIIHKYEVILGLLSLIIGGAVGGIVGVKVSVKVGGSFKVGGLVGGMVGGTIGLTVGVKVGSLKVRRELKRND